MKPIAAPARAAADQARRVAALNPRILFRKIFKSLRGNVTRKEEDDIAKQYEGSSWCDQTEHDLNYHVITGRQTGRS